MYAIQFELPAVGLAAAFGDAARNERRDPIVNKPRAPKPYIPAHHDAGEHNFEWKRGAVTAGFLNNLEQMTWITLGSL